MILVSMDRNPNKVFPGKSMSQPYSDNTASSFPATTARKLPDSVVKALLAVGPAKVPGALGQPVERRVGPVEPDLPDRVKQPRARPRGLPGQPAQKPVDPRVELGGVASRDGLHVQEREAVRGVDFPEEALVGVFEETVVVPDHRSSA